MFVIGTAGHVDHGKSALVRALTGIDPDRLQEEKDRGMTIDLGFAWLKLPSGSEVSIVDVPGHERFVKNMLAGVGGVDLALLVIAADEGVMPQSREHLAILDLLGVERGVLVVTKSDLVDSDWLDLVCADVEDVVKGTTLEGSPVVRCSAVTGEGLDDLLRVVDEGLAGAPVKRDLGRPRLPIDRAFTVSGFGTVVTGTLIDGSLVAGQEVEVLPAVVGGRTTSLRGRIRGLQTHRARVERAQPGTRTAVNLAGVDTEDLWRGQVVTTPGWLRLSTAVDVRLHVLESLRRPLRHNLNVTFHCFASETPAKLRLLEADEARPGDETWAQLRLAGPVAILKGDRFVIRDANTTIGGGTVVATQAPRHGRGRPAVIDTLERQRSGSPAEALLATIAAIEPAEPAAAFARVDLPNDVARAALDELVEEKRAVVLRAAEGPATVYTLATFDRLTERAQQAVAAYLREHPLRLGLAKEELRSRVGLNARLFSLALGEWTRAGAIEDRGQVVSPPGWSPALAPADQRQADAWVESLRASPYSPPTDGRPPEDLVAYLANVGRVVDVGAGVVFDTEAYRQMVRRVVAHMGERGKITLAEVRDLFGTSRRYAQALLEHLDQQRITRRVGDERLPGPAAK